MAADAYTPYAATKHFALGDFDWAGDTFKALLLDNTYTVDQTDEFVSDLVSHELSSGGYARQTISSKTNSLTLDTYTLSSSAGTIVWAGLTATGVRFMCLFKDTGSDATSPLIQIVDFGQDYSPSAEDFTYQIPVLGLITVVAYT